MNSQIEITEAAKLVEKLLDRTLEGKLPWELADPSLGSAGHSDTSNSPVELDRYSARLRDPSQRAVIEQRADGFLVFSLIEHDLGWEDQSIKRALAGPLPPKDRTVLQVSVEKEPSYGYDTMQESHLASLLVDLYGVARRSALKIDASVEKALSYLDRLAG
ncbi:MAG: hypothetical protein P4K83_12635 [Terracidiphilus sp.]|nr:hypothetical protein [Terracidiphilus sp.]